MAEKHGFADNTPNIFLVTFFFLNQLNIAIHTHKTYICMHMYTTVFLVSYNFLKNGLNFKAVVVVLFFP